MSGFIYNVTTNVSGDIHKQWLEWLKSEHIPEMIATGCFVKAVILRLKGVDDSDGPTYAVQYHTENETKYRKYLDEFSRRLREATLTRWGNKIVSFRTFMEVVN